MPSEIDWEAFDREVDEALDRAEARTDDRLASRVSSLTRLTDEEVKLLFPTPADVEKLKSLMKIVKAAETRNQRLKKLMDNIENLGGTVLTILERFA